MSSSCDTGEGVKSDDESSIPPPDLAADTRAEGDIQALLSNVSTDVAQTDSANNSVDESKDAVDSCIKSPVASNGERVENSSDSVTETSTTNNTFVPESEPQNSDGSHIESVVNSSSAIVSPVGSVSVTSPAAEHTELQADESKSSETLVECPNARVDDMPALSDPSVTVVSAASSDDDQDQQSIYHIKWIKFKGSSLPIITQNENGPCPLLAIMNLLFLQEKIKLASQMELITSSQLISYLADWIFEHVPKNISEDTRLNYEQNMHDAIAVFPRLQTGLDVNVGFTSVSHFEYTPECIVFDLLDIPLYHGWLVDPELPSLAAAVGKCTYNQLVEKIILQKSSEKEDEVRDALLSEEFLQSTASQMTYHGLSELSAHIQDEHMGVLFRNNHFLTLYKHKDELFVLVTDQGFLNEPNVVWETLSNIEGDSHFVDTSFRTYRQPDVQPVSVAAPASVSSFTVNSKEQIDHDYLVALSLEQEQAESAAAVSQPWSTDDSVSDHELAMRLQEEENQGAETVPAATAAGVGGRQATQPSSGRQPQAATSTTSGPTKDKKESSCSMM